MGAFEAFRTFVRAGRKEEDIMEAMRRQKEAAFGQPTTNRGPIMGKAPKAKPTSGKVFSPKLTRGVSSSPLEAGGPARGKVEKPSSRRSSPLEAGGSRVRKASISQPAYEKGKSKATVSRAPYEEKKSKATVSRPSYEEKSTAKADRPERVGKFTLKPGAEGLQSAITQSLGNRRRQKAAAAPKSESKSEGAISSAHKRMSERNKKSRETQQELTSGILGHYKKRDRNKER